jgi:hypothetical protein
LFVVGKMNNLTICELTKDSHPISLEFAQQYGGIQCCDVGSGFLMIGFEHGNFLVINIGK